jgi:hypothetical protein
MSFEFAVHVDDDGNARIFGFHVIQDDDPPLKTDDPEAVIKAVFPDAEVIEVDDGIDELTRLIRAAETPNRLMELWREHKPEWTQAHSSEASKRKAQL